MNFSKNLRYLRKLKNMSQDDLADLLGYKSFTTIQKWESGISEPSVAILKKLSEIFNVSMDELLNQDIKLNRLSKSMPSFEDTSKTFSTNLSFYMRKFNLSIDDIAEIGKVKRRKAESWLNGENTGNITSLQYLAEYFNITVHDLLSGNPDKSIDDLIKELLQNDKIYNEVGYNPKELSDGKIHDIADAFVSLLKLSLK